MCEASFRYLNFSLYPPHFISIYIYEVTIISRYVVIKISFKNITLFTTILMSKIMSDYLLFLYKILLFYSQSDTSHHSCTKKKKKKIQDFFYHKCISSHDVRVDSSFEKLKTWLYSPYKASSFLLLLVNL